MTVVESAVGRPFTTSGLSVSEAMVRVLTDAGIKMVFGIPGGNVVAPGGFVDALAAEAGRIRTVLVREESLAGVMAEVYGRLTGTPGVVFAQGAWLLTNAGMGALEGFMSGSPMILVGDFTEAGGLSHHAPYQAGHGEYGSWDARAAFRAFTKAVMVPSTPAQAVQELQLAIKHALAGQPGPVAYLLHSTIVAGSIGEDSFPTLYATDAYVRQLRQPAAEGDVAEAVRAIAASKVPVLLLGGGALYSHAFEEIAELSEMLGAPVATTPGGKGAFPETDELALGVFGSYGQPAANRIVGDADLLIAVGTKLGASDTAAESRALIDPARQTLVQIDIEPRNLAWTYPIHHPLLGDARTVLGQLIDALRHRDSNDASRTARVAQVRETKSELGYFVSEQASSDEAPLLPQRIIADLGDVLPADAIVCCDAGENRIFMTHFFKTKSVDSFVQSAGIGGMGYAIPAALGAKLAHPARPVVAVTGDGGFAMTMNGLMTALEESIPIVVVIFNNHALGWVKHEQAERDREHACDFPDYDHAAIARAIGCEGYRVDTAGELKPAIRAALSSGRPAVIDVSTSLKESFRRVTSPLLDRVSHQCPG